MIIQETRAFKQFVERLQENYSYKLQIQTGRKYIKILGLSIKFTIGDRDVKTKTNKDIVLIDHFGNLYFPDNDRTKYKNSTIYHDVEYVYIKWDRMECYNMKRSWFVNAYRIVDLNGNDKVQPWFHTKKDLIEFLTKRNYICVGELR